MTFTEQKYEHFMGINRFLPNTYMNYCTSNDFCCKNLNYRIKIFFLLNTNIINYLIQNDANDDCNNSATIARYV